MKSTKRFFRICLFCMPPGLFGSPAMAETLIIDREIPFGRELVVPGNVAGECKTGREFSGELAKLLGEQGFTVQFAGDSLRVRAAIDRQVATGNARRARVDLRVADIELQGAEQLLQAASNEKERSDALFRMEDARVKKIAAQKILANDAATTGEESNKYLFLEIDDADLALGSAWTQTHNRRPMHVIGEYRQGTKLIAAFTAQRATWARGLRGADKATCKMLSWNVRKLAEDIAEWMRAPVDGAGLGDYD